MSYILDALRRSQAERERGQVPGLDARPAAVAAVPSGPPGRRLRWAALVLAVCGVAVAVVLWGLRATPPAATAVPVGAGAPPEPALAAVAVPPPAPAPAPAPPPLPIVVSAPPPLPVPASATVGRAAAGGVPGAAARAVPAPSPGVTVAPPAASADTPLAALTAAQRRELPPLVMGGSIWSDSALSRFVIVNGQVVREGETAAPGVVVERIGPKAVWLRWRELRLEVPL